MTLSKKFDSKSLIFIFVGIVLGVLAITVANAQSSEIIQACVAQSGSNNQSQNLAGGGNTGSVRIVHSQDDCRSGETYITWNVQGPQGIPGPSGPPGQAGSGSGLVAYDSQDQEVGMLMGRNEVVRFISPDWVSFAISESEIGYFGILFEYESPDCTGPSYIESSGSLIHFGNVRGTQIYYSGSPSQYRHLFSTRTLDVDNNYTDCEQWDHFRWTGQTVTATLPTFVPPFTIGQQ